MGLRPPWTRGVNFGGTRWSTTAPVDLRIGELLPVVTLVTGNGGPFRSFRFEAFLALHPELAHVRTRVELVSEAGESADGSAASGR